MARQLVMNQAQHSISSDLSNSTKEELPLASNSILLETGLFVLPLNPMRMFFFLPIYSNKGQKSHFQSTAFTTQEPGTKHTRWLALYSIDSPSSLQGFVGEIVSNTNPISWQLMPVH